MCIYIYIYIPPYPHHQQPYEVKRKTKKKKKPKSGGMAEEFLQGGVVCGESWWNSLPCSLAFKMEMETVRSSDDSATHHHWNQDFLRWEENNSNLLLDWNSDSVKPSLNSMISSSAKCVTSCAEIGLSTGLPLSSDYALSLLDTDSQPQQEATINNQQLMNSNGFLCNSTTSSLTTNRKPHHTIRATATAEHHKEEEEDKDVVKKASHGPASKRPRIETPSMPTFKIRKEKLGDRITALQQLVSPFGKTDTASVLHEAIEYIKFLHDQVDALSKPYLKHGSPSLQQHQQGADKAREGKVLQSRRVCLVPISTTFPFASETESDFWTPTFGPR